MDKTHGAYEAPAIEEVGSVEELTLGQKTGGRSDGYLNWPGQVPTS